MPQSFIFHIKYFQIFHFHFRPPLSPSLGRGPGGLAASISPEGRGLPESPRGLAFQPPWMPARDRLSAPAPTRSSRERQPGSGVGREGSRCGSQKGGRARNRGAPLPLPLRAPGGRRAWGARVAGRPPLPVETHTHTSPWAAELTQAAAGWWVPALRGAQRSLKGVIAWGILQPSWFGDGGRPLAPIT